jgi:integrase
MDAAHFTLVSLLYGTGLRLRECLQLRIKDLDFDRKVLIVREGKGAKDRVVMLPQSLEHTLRKRLAYCRTLWVRDRADRVPGVSTPERVSRKYPRAAESWAWFWVFPSPSLSIDPRSGTCRRHHQYEQTVGRAISRSAARAQITKKVSAHTLRHYLPFLTMSATSMAS